MDIDHWSCELIIVHFYSQFGSSSSSCHSKWELWGLLWYTKIRIYPTFVIFSLWSIQPLLKLKLDLIIFITRLWPIFCPQSLDGSSSGNTSGVIFISFDLRLLRSAWLSPWLKCFRGLFVNFFCLYTLFSHLSCFLTSFPPIFPITVTNSFPNRCDPKTWPTAFSIGTTQKCDQHGASTDLLDV